MRINKYLSNIGCCSRRQADQLINNKQVKINNKLASLGDQVKEDDIVYVNNKKVKKVKEKVYLAFNKPVGVICTTDTREKDNIIDYINYPVRIYPIGRLDVKSSGLILLTNDGSIVNKILKAQNKFEKEYIVKVNKKITKDFLEKMRKGVKILGRKTLPAKVKQINDYSFKIVIVQGLNKQIRRMCRVLGYEVKELKRIRIGNIKLAGLKEGAYKKVKMI